MRGQHLQKEEKEVYWAEGELQQWCKLDNVKLTQWGALGVIVSIRAIPGQAEVAGPSSLTHPLTQAAWEKSMTIDRAALQLTDSEGSGGCLQTTLPLG